MKRRDLLKNALSVGALAMCPVAMSQAQEDWPDGAGPPEFDCMPVRTRPTDGLHALMRWAAERKLKLSKTNTHAGKQDDIAVVVIENDRVRYELRCELGWPECWTSELAEKVVPELNRFFSDACYFALSYFNGAYYSNQSVTATVATSGVGQLRFYNLAHAQYTGASAW